MPTDVSSSEPEKLGRYSVQMCLRDQDTVAACGPLRSALHHFEATCRESPFAFRASHVVEPVQGHANQCIQSDDWVGWVGMCFIEADGGTLGMYVPTPTPVPTPAPSASGPAFSGSVFWASLLMGVGKWAAENADDVVDISDQTNRLWGFWNVTGIITDTGLVSIRGGSSLKAALGWDRLTQLKLGPSTMLRPDSLATSNMRQLAWNAAKPKSLLPDSKLGWLGLGLLVGAKGYSNWQEYQDDGMTKVAVGTAVDVSIIYGASLIGKTAGSYLGGAVLGSVLGAASGGLLAPVGIAAGSWLGGMAGSMVGAWAGETLLQTNVDEWLTDNITAGLETAGEVVKDATVQIVDNIGDAAQEAGNALANTARQVGNAFGSFAGRVAALI